jgi:hypothetical protein
MYVLGHVQVFGILGAVAARAGAELGEGVGVTGGTLGAGGLWGAGVEGATGGRWPPFIEEFGFQGRATRGGGGEREWVPYSDRREPTSSPAAA